MVVEIKKLRWSEEEIRHLKDEYMGGRKNNLSEALPRRSRPAIWHKAKSMGLSKSHPLKIDTENQLLAYILGIAKGDGYIYEAKGGNYIIGLETPEKPFIDSFSESLKGIGLNPRIYGPYSNGNKHFPTGKTYACRPSYILQAHSKELYNWIERLEITNLEAYLNNPEKRRFFLKGFYESEGCVIDMTRYKNTKNPWRISFYNNNINLLELIRWLLTLSGYRPAPKILHCGDKRFNEHMLNMNIGGVQFLNWIKPSIKQQPRKMK